jgi:5-methylcytosine-specific restriction enzyme subunit McrC
VRHPPRKGAVSSVIARRILLSKAVSSVLYDPRRLPEISWNRINQRFRPATELARLVLRSRSLEFRAGEVSGAAFLLDMSSVFQDFVVIALREALGLSQRQFPQETRGRQLFLDEAERLVLMPDLSWWDDGRCLFVGDVKYKRTPESSGVLHPDVYQLLAYTTATRLARGLLIYAAGEAREQVYTVSPAGKELEVATLDLHANPDDVLKQIDRIGRRVRRQAVRRALVAPLAA